MPENAWIGELIAAAVYIMVGFRLARLASRTGERPEKLLSGMFFFTGISYVLYLIPMAIPVEALWTPFSFAGRVIYIPAPILLALFTRDVFRSEGRLPMFIVYATAGLLVLGVGASAIMGDWEGYSLSNPFFWFEWVGYSIPFVWAGAEALVQYRSSLRRHRLGLCERIVCNRFLLWACFGALQFALSFVLLAMYLEFEANNAFPAFLDRLAAVIELVSLSLIWFVFFPPRAYQKLVAGSSADGYSAERT
ncbi:MAG: hypothetical protein IH973_04620 [Myxococcales bacterium]|nr:hypothetical protein [Myxococcales bacterium]